MTARSIFQKVCPGCMATLARDARECTCGHQFDHDDADASLSSEEIRLKAEELYKNYLAARVEQATKAAQAAQADFARDPSNQGKSNSVASAMREVQAAESNLAAQSARVAEMKKALLPTAPPAAPLPVPVTTSARKRATALKAVTAKPQAQITRKPIPVLTEVVAAAPEPVRPKRHTKSATAAPRKLPAVVAVPVKQEVATPRPAQSATPNPAFRQAQAAKAEKILQALINTKPTSKPATKADKEVLQVTPAAKKPEATQAATPIPVKAAPRLYTQADKKECPNCTSSVPIAIARCRCGYEFPSSELLIPALAMSDEERAEFTKLFNAP